METLQVDRRKLPSSACESSNLSEHAHLVTQAIVLQASIGTLGAVEYMKAHKIQGAVIGRVLSGGAIREKDRIARDSLVA